MGADIIQAKYEELESIASCFGQWAEANADMNSRLERAMQTLQQGDWEGKGAAAFFAEMNGEVFPAMRRLIEALEKAQSVTLEVRNIIQDAEEEAARVFQGNGYVAEEGASNKDGGGESWWGKFGEWIHGGLDVAGFIPGFGEIADGVNALIYLAEGRHLEATISAVAMIPVFGDLGKAGKWGVKAGKEIVEEVAEEGMERVAKESVEEITEEGAEHTIKKSAYGGAGWVVSIRENQHVISKFPTTWGPGKPNKSGVGWRWFDPDNPVGNGVRIDQGNPSSPFPTQRVDHVVVRRDGKVLGRNGQPIEGSIKEDPINAHIPLSEYQNWSTWHSP